MASRIGGWNVTATSAPGAIAVATKAAESNKQHVIYAADASFSAAPGAPVLLTILDTGVSPNVVYWQGFLPVTNELEKVWPSGICIETGRGVSAILEANGMLVGRVNLHGITL